MTITQYKRKMRSLGHYNSNNSLTPGFNWALSDKRNNLNELTNIPTKAEERSTIQISFRTEDPIIKEGTIRNPRQNTQLIHDPQYFQNPQIRSIYGKNTQSMPILRPNPSIRKPINSPPPFPSHNVSSCKSESLHTMWRKKKKISAPSGNSSIKDGGARCTRQNNTRRGRDRTIWDWFVCYSQFHCPCVYARWSVA